MKDIFKFLCAVPFGLLGIMIVLLLLIGAMIEEFFYPNKENLE